MAKRATNSIRVKTAQPGGQPSGRVSKGLANVIAARRKTKSATRRKKTALAQAPKVDPVVAAQQVQAKARESWKAQEHDASAAVKAQHGTMIDERALARATDGHHWANRKPR